VINSTIGKKIIVAVTGLIMLGFVIGHLLGNLQIFEGAAVLNNYSAFLKHTRPLLWTTRIVLLVSIALHIFYTVQLNRRNRASRPVAYLKYEPVRASVSSRFMMWSGVFLLLYIVYHLLHLPIGVAATPFSETNVYANVIGGFQRWPIFTIYILGMIALGFHLNHGIGSVFQTLGLDHPRYNAMRRCFGVTVSTIIVAGYISIPVAVMLGIVR
jgi:succinate dehydrogenase / fumarate reductase cytochrome b subunit